MTAIRVLGIVSLLLVGPLAVSGAQSSAVHIKAVAAEDSQLTISGENFGVTAPTVTVGATTLVVSESSDTEIRATLPALAPGMYALTVQRDASPGGTAVGSLLIQ